MDPSYPIFHSFFEIDSFDIVPQSYDRGRPIFRGLFEDNDPKKRLMAIINYSTDISVFDPDSNLLASFSELRQGDYSYIAMLSDSMNVGRIEFQAAGGGPDAQAFDNVTIALPEPAAALLLGVGGVFLLRRR